MKRLANAAPLLVTALVMMLGAPSAQAAREPVLKQVDLPHSYYWRELYLPQLTSGPSSASFLPDGDTLVYSMGGSLWRQRIGDTSTTELTHPKAAYDYQPDASHDGRSVVFTRYDGNALELWRLELASGREQRLTDQGAVNVEPRLSPDGKRLAWVSTSACISRAPPTATADPLAGTRTAPSGGLDVASATPSPAFSAHHAPQRRLDGLATERREKCRLSTGHFNLFLADIDAAGLHHPHLLLGERKSTLDRYYYSAFDHAINPSWSPDGKTIYYVSNPEIGWGTGDIFAVDVDHPAQRRRVLSEETSWSARPELAPDGKRLLYASYHGRQHQQLWLTTADGAAPLPLSFGAFDRRNARWSPDGSRIAVIDNRDGDTALRVIETLGGASQDVVATQRHYRSPQAKLTLDIVDEHGQRTPARVAIVAGDSRAYAPPHAWVSADDGFDRALQHSETHYFHCAPPCTLDVPAGKAAIWVQHGFAYAPWRRTVDLSNGHVTQLTATLVPDALPAAYGHFVSADLHIHMNYGGHYRNTPAHLALQARAEDLDIAWDLVVNKEERVPDIASFRTDADPASTPQTLVLHGQEYHTSFWGHLGLLHLDDHYITQGYSAYRHTAMASPWPTNAAVADLAHAQGGLVGYVHPFDVLPDPQHDPVLSNELPADVVEGKVDYIEVMGFSDHKATATVWYRLLNLGFHLPTGAGTDAMANYASLRGPVGMNRVFLDTGGQRDAASALAALKAGHGFASNGPLLGFLLDGARPGTQLAPGRHHYRVALRSPVAVDHLELVHNGQVVKTFTLGGDRRNLDAEGDLDLDGGWVLLRAWNDGADPEVLDLYPYATTNPVWLGDHVLAASARDDAAWFARWMDRTIEAAAARDDYNTAAEKRMTLDYLGKAREAYRALAAGRSSTTAEAGR